MPTHLPVALRSFSFSFSFSASVSASASATALTILATPLLLAEVTANAGPDRTARAGGDCTAQVILDGAESLVTSDIEPTYTWRGSFPEGGGTVTGKQVTVTLEKGAQEIELTVAAGDESDSDTATVTVADLAPPEIRSIEPSTAILWPPNHEMVPIHLELDVRDNCDEAPECEITGVESNEPEDGRGDGHTTPDFEVTGPLNALLRAERSGFGSGRDYTLRVRCVDGDGNTGTARTHVRVPTDQGANQGKQEDICKLRVSFDDAEKCRMDLRLDIGTGQDAIPTNETPERGDDLEGYELAILLEGAELTAVLDDRGRALTDSLRAQWSPARRRLTVSLRGLDLPSLLELDPAVTGRRIEAQTPLSVTVTGPGEGAIPLEIYEDVVGCEYKRTARRR